MTASQLQAEQKLLADRESDYKTLLALIQERDACRDALTKINNLRFSPIPFEEKYDRITIIAAETLAKFQ